MSFDERTTTYLCNEDCIIAESELSWQQRSNPWEVVHVAGAWHTSCSEEMLDQISALCFAVALYFADKVQEFHVCSGKGCANKFSPDVHDTEHVVRKTVHTSTQKLTQSSSEKSFR